MKGNSMRIVGIHGKKGSGKDTFANFLQTAGQRVRLMAFADRMKAICSVVYGVPIRYFYNEDTKEMPLEPWGLSPRNMMTMMNDQLKSFHGEDYFVRVIKQDLAKIMELPDHQRPDTIVITDVRFAVEAEWMKEIDAPIVAVRRPSADVQEGMVHESEKGLPDQYISHYVENNQDLVSLLDKAIWSAKILGISLKKND
jgi:hypothetical protein